MRVIRCFQLAVLVICLLMSNASAQVTFSFNYTDAAGVGFNDNTLGAARRAALEQSSLIVSSLFTNYDATIVLDVDGSETNDEFLAGASANYNANPSGDGFNDIGDVRLKILNGNAADPSPSTADGSITWNFQDFQWELGNDFQANEYDFTSTAAHEIMHTVGFLSAIFENGEDAFGTQPGNPGIWTPLDQFVADSNGALINSDFELDLARWNAAKTGGTGSDGLFFIGPNAVAANNGNPVNLYSPTGMFEPGSSGSHLDDDFFNGTMIMEAAAATGPGVRTVSALERAMLRDVGYLNITSLLAGDFDSDGDVDANDIDFYAGNLNSQATGSLAQLDLNTDGMITIADYNLHVTTLVQTSNGQVGAFVGDANLDGIVDVLNDAAALVNSLGGAGTFATGDFNADQVVDVLNDAALLVDNLGNSNANGGASNASAVPEPTSIAATGLALVATGLRRKR